MRTWKAQTDPFLVGQADVIQILMVGPLSSNRAINHVGLVGVVGDPIVRWSYTGVSECLFNPGPPIARLSDEGTVDRRVCTPCPLAQNPCRSFDGHGILKLRVQDVCVGTGKDGDGLLDGVRKPGPIRW